MYSTWKIAFDRAWAGPSWTSWASRERSASWASTIRIWTSVGGLASASDRSVMRLASPRSRNSHVLSRLRWARSSFESSAWWSPSSTDSVSSFSRSIRSRASSAPASAATAAPDSDPAASSGAGRGSPTVVLAIRSIASMSSRRLCQRASSSWYASR